MSDPRTDIAHVSVHGGHTRFGDGEDSLAEVVDEYARQGFAWVGLTEHIPPVSDDFLVPNELEAGESAASRRAKFDEYVSVARALQKEYRDKLKVFVGFETECCTGYIEHVEELRKQHEPDYIVGSVHHVGDVVIDQLIHSIIIPVGKKHRAGVAVCCQHVSRAIIFLGFAGLLVFLDDVRFVVADMATAHDTDLLAALPGLAIQIDARTVFPDQRPCSLQFGKCFPGSVVNLVRIGGDSAMQRGLRSQYAHEGLGVAGNLRSGLVAVNHVVRGR